MAIVDAEKANWVAEPQGAKMLSDFEELVEHNSRLKDVNDGLWTEIKKAEAERDKAYASLEKILPHKPYHENCTCRNCSDYREAKELLTKRGK